MSSRQLGVGSSYRCKRSVVNFCRLGLFAVATMLLACASVSAQALDGTWRPPPVGVKFILDTGLKREVVGVKGNYVYLKGDRSRALRDTQWSSCRGILPTISGDGTKRRFDCDAIAALFPLKVRNKSKFYASEDGRRFRVKYFVASVEKIETPIGIKTVFRIKYYVAATDGRFAQRGTIYFDPALGIGQQGSYITDKGKGGFGVWSIVNLELPK